MALSEIQYLFTLFWLLASAEPCATFETTCSLPTSSVRYVSSPDARGTLEILWSSLFTIFACTWTIQHPNIPEQRDNRSPRGGDLHWRFGSIYESVTLAIYTIIAPEIVILVAIVELTLARENSRKLKQEFKQDGVLWTMSHSFFANMGGYIIRTSRMEDHAYHDPYHLTADNIYDLRRSGHLKKLPDVTEEELHDRSKSDSLLKAIALGQILWSIMQIIARGLQKLTISPLELSVLAYAACSIIIYALYWKKPKSVQIPSTIAWDQNMIPSVALKILEKSETTPSLVWQYLVPRNSALRARRPVGSPIQNMGLPSLNIYWTVPSVVGFTSAAIFGGIHCVGWNFDFPSRVELMTWRCASVYTAVFGLFISLWFWFFDGFLRIPTRASNNINNILDLRDWGVMSMTYLYVAARLFILVEVFRTLFYLPPDAFTSTWTSSIPHFS